VLPIQITSITILPAGSPPMVTSKKTFGFAAFFPILNDLIPKQQSKTKLSSCSWEDKKNSQHLPCCLEFRFPKQTNAEWTPSGHQHMKNFFNDVWNLIKACYIQIQKPIKSQDQIYQYAAAVVDTDTDTQGQGKIASNPRNCGTGRS
jgi:hypothetical protein